MARRTKKKKTVWTDVERSAWKLPEVISVSKWAEKYRRIGSYSAEPGPWRNDRAPYLAGIMDAYSDPEVAEITITGPAQCGKTEAVFNMIGYTVAVDPVPVMYVTARDDDCESISADRLWPMFNNSPALAAQLPGTKRDFAKGSQIRFNRMSLYFASAQSAAGLALKPIGRVFLDETDKFPAQVGDEGSPAKLAKRRTQTFGDTKAVYLCTMTTTDGYISKSLKKSNMMTRQVPCPECGEYIRLLFAQLKVDPPDLRDPEEIIRKECVYYECQKCGGHIPESKKNEMDRAGVWVPEGCTVDKEGDLHGKAKRGKRHSGFWIDGMLSPWILWHEMIAEWFEIREGEGGEDIDALREFLNQVIGQEWKDRAKEVAYEKLLTKKNELPRCAVPEGCVCLTAGADYHVRHNGDIRIDYEARAWAPGMRNYVICSGSVDSFEVLEDELILHPFPWAGECDAEELAVTTLFIDSGFHPDDVYDFCRKYPGICYPTKGQQFQRTPLTTTALDKMLSKPGSRRRGKAGAYRGITLINIDTNYFKNLVSTMAERPAGEANCTEFYADCPDVYFREFCNEHQVRKKSRGIERLVWEPVSAAAPTHFLDTAVGAAAAGYWQKVHLIRPERPRVAAAVKRAQRSLPTRRSKQTRKGGFLDDIPEI